MRKLCGLCRLALLGLIAGGVLLDVCDVEAQWATPEIDEIVVLDEVENQIFAMRAELGTPAVIVGMALICDRSDNRNVMIDVYFGGFPRDRRPVQLAVRTADGAVERFGPVLRGGRESGFHSPRLVDGDEIRRFIRVALSPDALVSNGYRSFWNRVAENRNSEVREAFTACLNRVSSLGGGGLPQPERLGLRTLMVERIVKAWRKLLQR